MISSRPAVIMARDVLVVHIIPVSGIEGRSIQKCYAARRDGIVTSQATIAASRVGVADLLARSRASLDGRLGIRGVSFGNLVGNRTRNYLRSFDSLDCS